MSVRLQATLRGFGGETQLASARAAWRQRAGLVLTLRGGGAVGQGEAAPLPGYSRETLQACAAALQAVRWDALRAPGAPDEVAGVVEAALGAEAPAAARCAVEAALWDWLGRRTGLPVWGLLGGAHAELPLSGLWDERSSVGELRRRGVRVVKVKVGRAGGWKAEWAVLQALRDADLVPRVDANCGWPAALATQRLAELSVLAPELVEEPLEGGLLAGAAAGAGAGLLTRSGLRLAADESLAGAALAGVDAALAAGWLGALVLKPMLLGGIGPCVTLARRALEAGAHIVVTHTWDGPLGLATAAALALALASTSTSTSRGRVLAAGLSHHGGLAAWPALALPMLRDDRLVTLDTPGLGLAELPS